MITMSGDGMENTIESNEVAAFESTGILEALKLEHQEIFSTNPEEQNELLSTDD